MPFINVIHEEHAEGLVREHYKDARKNTGYVPNYTRAFSLRPQVYAAWNNLISTIRSNMRLRRYELVTIAAALALECDYCTLAHGAILRKNFFDADQFRAIVRDFRNAGLSPQDVAVMEFATRVARQANCIRSEDTATLRAHGLTDAEILDVILAVAARSFFSTVLLATGAEPDEGYADLRLELNKTPTLGRKRNASETKSSQDDGRRIRRSGKENSNTGVTRMDMLSPEMKALKSKLQATWMSGDYGVFAKYLEPGALEIINALDIPHGSRILDVGCGAGQIAIPLARKGYDVTGVDIATNLIAQARARANDERVNVRFQEGDAEDLQFPDASFDVVISLIGAMFAPRPERVATELTRVCRPGGTIYMMNWTPRGFVGQMFKTIAKHVPTSPLMASPVLWGDEATVRERLDEGIGDLMLTRKMYPSFAYPFGVSNVVEFFRRYYGPTNRAFAALDETGQAALRFDLELLWAQHNRATDGTTCIEAEYLEVIATRSYALTDMSYDVEDFEPWDKFQIVPA